MFTKNAGPTLLFAVAFLCIALSNASSQSPSFDPRATLENIIAGIYEGDYAKYSMDFSPAMKQAQDRESLMQLQRKLQKTLGKLDSLEYFGHYRQYGNIVHLFKARFSKEKDDVLIKLVAENDSSDAKISGLWLDAPSLR
jgi:hypothetical protein